MPSTLRSQHVKSTSASERFWKLYCPTKTCGCEPKYMSKSKCDKHVSVRMLVEFVVLKEVHAAVGKSTFRSQHFQTTLCSAHFWTFKSHFLWHAQWILHFNKREPHVRTCSSCKTMAGVGCWKRLCKGASRVAGALEEAFLSDMLGGDGDDFRREVAFESIRSSGLRRGFCVTGAALP